MFAHSWMECADGPFTDSDFLNVWQEIQRTIIFDDSWVMSSQWLHISQSFPEMKSFSFGDVSCKSHSISFVKSSLV
jgi:hypothetical protein